MGIRYAVLLLWLSVGISLGWQSRQLGLDSSRARVAQARAFSTNVLDAKAAAATATSDDAAAAAAERWNELTPQGPFFRDNRRKTILRPIVPGQIWALEQASEAAFWRSRPTPRPVNRKDAVRLGYVPAARPWDLTRARTPSHADATRSLDR